MMSIKGFVLVFALTQAFSVSCDEAKSDISDAAKKDLQKGINTAEEGIEKAENAFTQAKERIGDLASNFSKGFKDRFNDGIQKAEEVLTKVKDTVSTHVSPFVNKIRTGMLDGVRNLRDKLNSKNKTVGGGEEGTQKDSLEFDEKTDSTPKKA